MNQPNVFLGFDASYEESDIVLFGAPFDGTTSFRPGTRFGPDHMRRESIGLELFSPYLNRSLVDRKLFDYGDLEFSFGNPAQVLEQIEVLTRKILSDGKKPLMIGGEHLVTYGSVKAMVERYPDLRIIHLDAHADLRDDYMGEKFSHATVIRRCTDHLEPMAVYQFGIRSGSQEEFAFQKDHTTMERFTIDSLVERIEELKAYPVYLTIDLDVLDPSVFPGTGTPEPGGIKFQDLMWAFEKMASLEIVGADLVELSPHYDATGVSTAVAAKALRELALIL
jgi:agmatinase